MTINGKNSKAFAKMNCIVSMGERYDGVNLHDVYGRPSYNKQRAWDWCFEQFCKIREDGLATRSFHIASHNCMKFTVAWDLVDAETGEIKGIHVETAHSTYDVIF